MDKSSVEPMFHQAFKRSGIYNPRAVRKLKRYKAHLPRTAMLSIPWIKIDRSTLNTAHICSALIMIKHNGSTVINRRLTLSKCMGLNIPSSGPPPTTKLKTAQRSATELWGELRSRCNHMVIPQPSCRDHGDTFLCCWQRLTNVQIVSILPASISELE